jgi:sugar transferase (PEP-CTERM/EpsH1 system associated)
VAAAFKRQGAGDVTHSSSINSVSAKSLSVRIDAPSLHIVHIIWRFQTGGLENGVVNLINHLPEADYHHSIVTLTGADPNFVQRIYRHNVSFYDLDKQPGPDMAMFLRLNQLLKQLQPDILHTRNLTSIECQLIGWWRKIPLRIHGEHGWDINDIGGQNVKFQRLRRLLRPFIQRYIALSSESVRYLTGKIGVATDKITHICNGVDIDRFKQPHLPPADMPVSFRQADALIFGTVGRMAKVKNQQLLVRAFALLHERFPQATLRLVLAGDGAEKNQLQQLAQQLQVSEHIWFAGDRSDINAIMQSMHVFVLPSLAEGISNTILEAMASGKPVIATAVGGNPDLLPPMFVGENLVDPHDAGALADAMARYVTAPQLCQQHGLTMQAYCAEHFSIARMVAQYHDIYQTLKDVRVS